MNAFVHLGSKFTAKRRCCQPKKKENEARPAKNFLFLRFGVKSTSNMTLYKFVSCKIFLKNHLTEWKTGAILGPTNSNGAVGNDPRRLFSFKAGKDE
jgi:hypothetical protein